MRPRSTSAAAPPPPASPAPGTSPKSGATKRQRKAVPLGDVTNQLLLRPETPTPIKPRRTARRPFPTPSSASAVSSTCSSSSTLATPALKPSSSSSSASATPAHAPEPSASAPVTPAPPQPSSSATVTPAPRPPSTASATPTPTPEPSSAATVTPTPTPAPKPSFAAVLEEEGRSVFESPTICTVYARRRTTEVEAEGRINPTVTNNKGKEPVGAAASCPPLGKSTRNIRKKDAQPISSSAPCHEAKKKRPLASTPKLPEEFVKKQKAYFADVDAFELAEEEVSESELE